MNIPNDTGAPWRLNKFVEYQHYAAAVDPPFYCEFAKMRRLDADNLVLLAWYHSMTYCEVTACLLIDRLPLGLLTLDRVQQFWTRNKPRLIFNSARAYAKNMDWFVPLMETFLRETHGQPWRWLYQTVSEYSNPSLRFKRLSGVLHDWKYMGRFSVELFTEALENMYAQGLISLEIKQNTYDWRSTSNLTSGLLNVFYRDKAADLFDAGKLPMDASITSYLYTKLEVVKLAVRDAYPNQGVEETTVINKICSFRNLFKGTRYGGYHHDRQLGNLVRYQETWPGLELLWETMYDMRSRLFARNMLGEYMGWEGIRPERKKLWLTEGRTGVEPNV